MAFTRSEARLTAAREELPKDAEKLPERTQRAMRAAAELEAEYRNRVREGERLQTQLEERGGEGLYAKEMELQDALEVARARAAELRREGLGSRLLCELIERREQKSIHAVLHPLEDRLTETFAALTGVVGRRVWFDEHLAVLGIGARREELIPFEDLSRGARELLLLALRAAIALQLAETDGEQCLVLDDVLTHTDAVRHENVLDFLQTLATRIQVILLTCHGERYRGVGHAVPIGEEPSML